MLAHKGGRIKNVQLITGMRIAEMSQLQNCSVMCTKNGSYCENEKKREVRGKGQRGCVQRMEVIVKREKKRGGGWGWGGLGQGRCERRSEAFVKILFFFWGGGECRIGSGGGFGGSGWM